MRPNRVLSAFATCFALALLLGSASQEAHAGIQVTPLTVLPATPSGPYLWFDGSNAAAITALKARIQNARTSALYTGFKQYVDSRIAGLANADDDTRSKMAKGAALLHLLGQTPPQTANGPTTYREIAVRALTGMKTRQSVDSLAEFVTPPVDAVDILQDSSRLQSMAEAYDLLRGSGISAENDTTIRARIANWADAIKNDWNLTGAFGIQGHRDNWGIKGGAGLVTAALAMPNHGSASGWLGSGLTYINESLAIVASTTGWYGEGVWYINYALANLWPAAWHMKNAAGVDWFGALQPLVDASLVWRQPDGRGPPFEEGLPNTFPWDIMATAYPALAPTMLWAWENSPKNDENFENQQFHQVTRFLLADLTTVAAAPTAPTTRMLGDDAFLAALRTSWNSDALMVTTITARDFSTNELTDLRHNMRNPLDLILHGAGALVMPTASGGPTATTSPHRASYLLPTAKNIPLVAKNAPFVAATSSVNFHDRLDSEDEGTPPNHYVDFVRTALTNVYALSSEVSRAVALVDKSYVVVFDRFKLAASAELDLSWRGRGVRSLRSDTTTLQSYSWAGISTAAGTATPRLDVDTVGTGSLSREDNASYYANGWNQEETINGVLLGATAREAAFITVLQVGTTDAKTVTALSNANAAGAEVTSGTLKDTLIHNLGSGKVAVGAVTTDATAALVRTKTDPTGGVLGAFAVADATVLDVGSVPVVRANKPVTLALTAGGAGLDAGFVAELSVASQGAFTAVIDGIPGFDPNETYQATLEGNLLGANNFAQSGTQLTFTGLQGGTLVVSPAKCRKGTGEDPDGDRICGSADNCPSIANLSQLDTDQDGIGDVCECLDAAVRCDDGNTCSVDGCVATTGACTHAGVGDGKECDDQSVCTSGDHCVGTACVPAAVLDCDDGNDCTKDACDRQKGCQQTVRTGEACSDNSACTKGDTCTSDAACVGTAIVCDDGLACTSDVCNPASGCEAPATPAGVACNDGSACTAGDACDGHGACGGAAVDCSTTLPCKVGTCDAASGCGVAPAPVGTACNDHNACSRDDHCAANGSCGGAAIVCNDGNDCTSDACDPATGCTTAPTPGVACSDGSACTSDDMCSVLGSCDGMAVVCDDHNPCTADRCDPARGCVYDALNAASCDDGNACTGGDLCVGSTCRGAVVSCDDGNACTSDACDAAVGCVHGLMGAGIVCDDRDRCTTGDHCEAGACAGAALGCDDGNPCTYDGCDEQLGCAHVAVPGGTTCNDGNACTTSDACADGVCRGVGLQCDDGDPCTVDSCTVGVGCAHVAASDATPCDDHDACTDGDQCAGGTCVGAAPTCADEDPCTIDRCDPEVGCVSTLDPGGACDDGDGCTTLDVCSEGVCAGEPVDCDDGDACTNDACVDGTCVHPAIACEAGEHCEEGVCTAGPAEVEAGGDEAAEVGVEAVESGVETGADESDVADVADGTGDVAESEDASDATSVSEVDVGDSSVSEVEDDAVVSDSGPSDTTSDAEADEVDLDGADGLEFGGGDTQVIKARGGRETGCASGGGDLAGAAGALFVMAGVRAYARRRKAS